MGGKERARIALYAMAGVYLLILAYNMFHNLGSSVNENERIITIVFIVVFIVAGGAMVSLGIWDGYRNAKKMRDAYYADPEVEELSDEITGEIVEDKSKIVIEENKLD
ncbi:MAG: hypothetical protein R3Y58_09285 [Eubacteriales bacterium]